MDGIKSHAEKSRAILEVTLEEVWHNEQMVHLGYCPHCGELNIKAKVIGHFDDWTIKCPRCGKNNHVMSLRFQTQTRR